MAQKTGAADQEAFLLGVELFNGQKFWHAHEAWEGIWISAPRLPAAFLQGLIQLAAAYHHLQRGTVRGAVRLFDSGLRRLDGYPSGFCGVEREALVSRAARHREFAAAATARLGSSGRISTERIAAEEFPFVDLADGWKERLDVDLKWAG